MIFRIKIEVRNNGTKGYTPQIRKGTICRGFLKRFNIRWNNIIGTGYSHPFTSSNMREIFPSEEEALVSIESYKEHIKEVESKETKTTTYKYI